MRRLPFKELLVLSGLACHLEGCVVRASLEQDLLQEAISIEKWTIQHRRALHQIPELKYEEHATSKYLRDVLDELSIPYQQGIAGTGIVGSIGHGNPLFALRADMDALPIDEESEDSWKSRHPGKCHCCSHDSHMAMLLSAARLLKQRESGLKGTVQLIFQPAEEGGAGASKIVEAGILDRVSGVFGIHAWPSVPSGVISSKAGVIMAATDKFVVRVVGVGGHGGQPERVKDAIVAASMIVVALQPLISRELSPTESAILGITRFNTGAGSNNVHPDEVELNGTLNALTASGLESLRHRFEEVVRGTALLYRCSASITYPQITYPPTINDAHLVSMVGRVAEGIVGRENWQIAEQPSMAAEDFAWLGNKVPGAYVWLGIGGPGTDSGLHTPTFRMDESQLPVGAALHAAVALRALAMQQHYSGREEL